MNGLERKIHRIGLFMKIPLVLFASMITLALFGNLFSGQLNGPDAPLAMLRMPLLYLEVLIALACPLFLFAVLTLGPSKITHEDLRNGETIVADAEGEEGNKRGRTHLRTTLTNERLIVQRGISIDTFELSEIQSVSKPFQWVSGPAVIVTFKPESVRIQKSKADWFRRLFMNKKYIISIDKDKMPAFHAKLAEMIPNKIIEAPERPQDL